MMKDDDFKLLKGFALRRTDERTNERTFVIVEWSFMTEKHMSIHMLNVYIPLIT